MCQMSEEEQRERKTKNLIRLVKEYVEVTECTCEGDESCWHCVFKFNLGYLAEETGNG